MTSTLLFTLFTFLSYLLTILFALMSDALRFAQFGYIKHELNKKYHKKETYDIQLKRMEAYFDDEDQNLRELEWGYFISFCLSLFFYLSALQTETTTSLTNSLISFSFITFLVTGVFVRGFSEPYSETILIKCYYFWRIWHKIATPLRLIQTIMKILVQRIRGVEEEEEQELEEQKILDSMEDGKKAGVFEDSEQEMIENLIEFKDLDVAEIMTPRTDMAAVPIESSVMDVIKSMTENRFSRILIFEENRDQIIGFVHIRDLLPFWTSATDPPPLKSLIRDPYFVPETKKIRTLFQEFKSKHLHIAVVLDEYGGTAGLVTLEDILEEIVGDIVDEHQEDEVENFEKISDDNYFIQAKLRITELEEIFNIEIEENESYDSVGGLLIAHLGRIPAQGERGILNDFNLKYHVITANERKIEKLKLTLITQEENE